MSFVKKYLSYFVPIISISLLYSISKYPINPFYLVTVVTGALLGLVLSQTDHLIYVFFTNTHEVTSQRAIALVNASQWKKTIYLLLSTSQERKDLIFHKIWFQILFFILTIFAISSSSNLFGKGIVIGFFLSSIVSLIKQISTSETMGHWLSGLPIFFKVEKIHIVFYIVLLLILLALSMLVY